jgi:hypothetical protein
MTRVDCGGVEEGEDFEAKIRRVDGETFDVDSQKFVDDQINSNHILSMTISA